MRSNQNQKYIFICGSKDCQKNGSEQLKSALKELIKENNLKDEVRIIKTKCMDFCKSGPNLIVQDHLYHKVSSREAKAILNKLFEKPSS
ncbi:(2Fe-2S) ferredoxin domain-containing protein [Marivirga sp. S37H4]|uniref:(2Fe-2S) ferredoxin domain-containing protein n=1 Tax=Marivirga aurantiaca TaxID=2802615 RepID=A0A934X1H3_9BACT|nr:(2Fe-2S) ferredoxin domain-containing protein [Marivirga aurantiaca]MBK6267248.1 (2Fe-2S) ferredoxin domain-containing protein [Marivirga aurantiaca]